MCRSVFAPCKAVGDAKPMPACQSDCKDAVSCITSNLCQTATRLFLTCQVGGFGLALSNNSAECAAPYTHALPAPPTLQGAKDCFPIPKVPTHRCAQAATGYIALDGSKVSMTFHPTRFMLLSRPPNTPVDDAQVNSVLIHLASFGLTQQPNSALPASRKRLRTFPIDDLQVDCSFGASSQVVAQASSFVALPTVAVASFVCLASFVRCRQIKRRKSLAAFVDRVFVFLSSFFSHADDHLHRQARSSVAARRVLARQRNLAPAHHFAQQIGAIAHCACCVHAF